jgi:hypothetical protein
MLYEHVAWFVWFAVFCINVVSSVLRNLVSMPGHSRAGCSVHVVTFVSQQLVSILMVMIIEIIVVVLCGLVWFGIVV